MRSDGQRLEQTSGSCGSWKRASRIPVASSKDTRRIDSFSKSAPACWWSCTSHVRTWVQGTVLVRLSPQTLLDDLDSFGPGTLPPCQYVIRQLSHTRTKDRFPSRARAAASTSGWSASVRADSSSLTIQTPTGGGGVGVSGTTPFVTVDLRVTNHAGLLLQQGAPPRGAAPRRGVGSSGRATNCSAPARSSTTSGPPSRIGIGPERRWPRQRHRSRDSVSRSRSRPTETSPCRHESRSATTSSRISPTLSSLRPRRSTRRRRAGLTALLDTGRVVGTAQLDPRRAGDQHVRARMDCPSASASADHSGQARIDSGGLSAGTRYALLSAAAGGLGAGLQALLTYATYVQRRAAVRLWVPWLMLRVPTGMALGVIAWLVVWSVFLSPGAPFADDPSRWPRRHFADRGLRVRPRHHEAPGSLRQAPGRSTTS